LAKTRRSAGVGQWVARDDWHARWVYPTHRGCERRVKSHRDSVFGALKKLVSFLLSGLELNKFVKTSTPDPS